MKEHPDSNYRDVEEKFLQDDGNIDYSALSPRFFECAMTKTCQILAEGDYGDVMKPGVHFIEIKRDFSNINDVIEQIKNRELCERIAQNAYNDLIESGKYTYDAFVELVISKLNLSVKNTGRNTRVDRYLSFNDLSIYASMKVKECLRNIYGVFRNQFPTTKR